MRQKILTVSLLFMLCFSFVFPVSAMDISAECACVLDRQTGRIIYEKNAQKQHTMASTTKIMTALCAIEAGNLTDRVTVSKNAAGTEGTSLYLTAGEVISLEDLLYGLMLQSGNDAAIAIAEHISGSVKAFAEKMTQRAREIGAKNTAFQNPNGLDEEGHYTTAYDLALITREALNNETFAAIVATKSKALAGNRTVTNHNKLLNQYPGCVGVKTGFTKKSGRCLVSSAVKNGVQAVCVTLNAPSDWSDHTKMLDYAFLNTVRFPLLAAGMTVNAVTVKNGSAASLPLCAESDFYLSEHPDTRFSNASVSLKLPPSVTAPVQKGEVLGQAEIYYHRRLLGSVNLLAAADVAVDTAAENHLFWKNFKKLLLFGCTT